MGGQAKHTAGPKWEATNIFGTWYVEWVTGGRSAIVTVVSDDAGAPLIFPSRVAAEKKARALNRAAIAKALFDSPAHHEAGGR